MNIRSTIATACFVAIKTNIELLMAQRT